LIVPAKAATDAKKTYRCFSKDAVKAWPCNR
jgi:hypothetical protein